MGRSFTSPSGKLYFCTSINGCVCDGDTDIHYYNGLSNEDEINLYIKYKYKMRELGSINQSLLRTNQPKKEQHGIKTKSNY